MINEAESVEPELQDETGNLERIVQSAREIGVDYETEQATPFYTVITDLVDNLITAFPGFPPY